MYFCQYHFLFLAISIILLVYSIKPLTTVFIVNASKTICNFIYQFISNKCHIFCFCYGIVFVSCNQFPNFVEITKYTLSIPLSSQSESNSGGPTKVHTFSKSHNHIFSTKSSGETTFPTDFAHFAPFLVIIP